MATRTVYRLHLHLDAVVDLRDSGLTSNVEGDDPPGWLIDKERAHSVARHLRSATPAQVLLVPSVAFLDDLTRWNLVVFLDKLPADPQAWIQRVETVGPLRWGD